MALEQLLVATDANKRAPSGGPPKPSGYVNVYILSAGVAKTITFPTGATTVFFSSTHDFWINFNATAAVPTIDITNGSAPDLNPAARHIDGLTSCSVISEEDNILVCCFHA